MDGLTRSPKAMAFETSGRSIPLHAIASGFGLNEAPFAISTRVIITRLPLPLRER